MAFDLRTSELEHDFIKERISSVEKHMCDICSKFTIYTKKKAHLRDSGDDLAKTVLQFASKEILNQSLRIAMGQLSEILTVIQDYREAEVQRLDIKVILELKNYGSMCKKAKDELKKSFEARGRELAKKNQLEKMRGKKTINWQQIAQVEKEVTQAQGEATRTTCELAKQIDLFEKQKLQDIKRVFLEFIKIELLFHAKALEHYTKAYNTINSIKIDEDLKEFRNHFKAYCSTLDFDQPNQNKEEHNDSFDSGPSGSCEPAFKFEHAAKSTKVSQSPYK